MTPAISVAIMSDREVGFARSRDNAALIAGCVRPMRAPSPRYAPFGHQRVKGHE